MSYILLYNIVIFIKQKLCTSLFITSENVLLQSYEIFANEVSEQPHIVSTNEHTHPIPPFGLCMLWDFTIATWAQWSSPICIILFILKWCGSTPNTLSAHPDILFRRQSEAGGSQRQTFDPRNCFITLNHFQVCKTYSDRNQSIKLMCCDMMDTSESRERVFFLFGHECSQFAYLSFVCVSMGMNMRGWKKREICIFKYSEKLALLMFAGSNDSILRLST